MNLIVEEALSRLAIARSSELDDLSAQVYLDALADISPQTVSRACADLAKEPRQEFESALPSVGIIRGVCAAIIEADRVKAQAAKLLPAPKQDEDGPLYFCLECQDTGWRMFFCVGMGPQRVVEGRPRMSSFPCARLKPHGPHTFVERCSCVETNPIIAQTRQREAEIRQKRETRHRAS